MITIFKRIYLKVKNIVIFLSFLLDYNINYCVFDFFSSVLFAFVPVFELHQIERELSQSIIKEVKSKHVFGIIICKIHISNARSMV